MNLSKYTELWNHHHNLILQPFHHQLCPTLKISLCLLQSFSIFTFISRQQLIFGSSIDLHAVNIPIIRIRQYITFWDKILSVSIIVFEVHSYVSVLHKYTNDTLHCVPSTSYVGAHNYLCIWYRLVLNKQSCKSRRLTPRCHHFQLD